MKVLLGSDHAGVALKERVKEVLDELSLHYEDLGTHNDDAVDYPDYAKKVASRVGIEDAMGVLICGTGTGMVMAANRVPGARAAVCYDEYTARKAREDNDANIIALRAREQDTNHTLHVVRTFFTTDFSGKERHQRRVDKLTRLESWQ